MKHITTTIALGLFALATPVFAEDAKSASNPAVATAKKDIVDTAVAAGSFKTLAAALQAAGLVDALKGDGPFTVFAPTDEAFAKLPKGTVEDLLKKENKDKLVEILTYHVVSGKVMAKTAVTLDKATALNKKDIALAVKDKSLTLNSSAKVIKADIDCTNGVIHVIDSVILPPAK
jgi:transforming growth factor-beta-induced protein